eukprot:6613163-Pyramimonas_sp.AAC.1
MSVTKATREPGQTDDAEDRNLLRSFETCFDAKNTSKFKELIASGSLCDKSDGEGGAVAEGDKMYLAKVMSRLVLCEVKKMVGLSVAEIRTKEIDAALAQNAKNATLVE